MILSRTDSIGDVVLTLPMAGLLKKYYPQCRIIFLGRTYTRDVVALSRHVDEFVNYDAFEKKSKSEQVANLKSLKADAIVHVFPRKDIAKLAQQAGILLRIGTMSRLYHWLSCNRLMWLPRKNSDLHEAQLNLLLLKKLGVQGLVKLNDIPALYGFLNLPVLPVSAGSYIDREKINVILHPKSKGSAREWGLDNFGKLIQLLPSERFKIFICGTAEDGETMTAFTGAHRNAVNLCGQLSLSEYIAFINACDALVAASTGPLHIAAALEKRAIGLFTSRRPMHPGRWAPLGLKASHLVYDVNCEACKQKQNCNCIQQVSPQQVVDLLLNERL